MSIPPFLPSELKRFEQSAKDAIALALVLGWTARWTNRKRSSVTLRNYNGDKVIIVPTTNVNANRARAWLQQIATHTHPDGLRRLVNGDIDLMRAEPEIARIVAIAGTSVLMTAKEYVLEQRAAQAAPHLTQTVAEAVPLEFKGDDEADSLDAHFVAEEAIVHEVKRSPLMVRRGGARNGAHRNYESKGVEVITYSDGTTGYGCKFCTFTGDASRGVSTHVGHAHKGMGTPDFLIELREKKREETPVTDQSQPPVKVEVQPALRGVPLLTHHLRAAMTRSDQARDVAVEITSLDFETRARLAHVILMGKDSETMRAAAEARIAEVEVERDAAAARASSLQQDWDALQDLLGRRT